MNRHDHSGLNFQDLIIRLGAIASPPKTPCILGFECAGEVEAIGEEVTAFAVGDRVVALPEFKAWAELVAVSERFVYKLPEGMSYAEAAAITLSYAVAHVLVFELASIKPGNSVLLHSAGGGVVGFCFRLMVSCSHAYMTFDCKSGAGSSCGAAVQND